MWRYVYLGMKPDIQLLGERASAVAEAQGVTPARLLYMWPDAVASYLYHSSRARRRACNPAARVSRSARTLLQETCPYYLRNSSWLLSLQGLPSPL